MMYVQMVSYAALVTGRTPPADSASARSKESRGADRAEPKEVLCSNTYGQVCQIHTGLRCILSRLKETGVMVCVSKSLCIPDHQLHKLTGQPTVASLPVPVHPRPLI